MSSPAPTETQRLFFALWPDAALRSAISRFARHVGRGGRPVSPENFHITLAFLGSVTASTRVCVEHAADAVRVPPFAMSLDRVGHWPRPRVVWLGATETPGPLRALVVQLNRGLEQCGLRPDSRPFQPHLTILRKVSRGPARTEVDPLQWRVELFTLVESTTFPSGAVYRVLRQWPLVPPV